MSYILHYKKGNTLKITPEKDTLNKLYYLDATVPNKEQIKRYLKNPTNKEITIFNNRPFKYKN